MPVTQPSLVIVDVDFDGDGDGDGDERPAEEKFKVEIAYDVTAENRLLGCRSFARSSSTPFAAAVAGCAVNFPVRARQPETGAPSDQGVRW
jgi:hypothetical protein